MTNPLSQILATGAYSKEQLALNKRAVQITHTLFAARRQGRTITKAEAIALVDEKAANDDNTPEPTPTAFTRANVSELVSDGKFFSVEFIKRTTGELRTMQARIGVTKYLKGGTKKFDDASKNLLTVFSMDANGYRSIPIDAIQAMTVHGQRYVAV